MEAKTTMAVERGRLGLIEEGEQDRAKRTTGEGASEGQ
jgi:hypothetical protein